MHLSILLSDLMNAVEIKDRFVNAAKPREWFLVPLTAINEVVEKIQDGSIAEYEYNPKTARLNKY